MITPFDLREAASMSVAVLAPALDKSWSASAGELDWSCHQTADHIPEAMLFYSVQLATQADHRVPKVRQGEHYATVEQAVGAIGSAAAVLAEVAVGAGPEARGFHPAGMADTEGFLAMGVDEILVHTWDIAQGLGLEFHPPAGLVDRVLSRLFPWAPEGAQPWPALLWCNGRMELDGHPRLDDDWYWQCAPLSEWDGTIKKRTEPPPG